ncbi:Cathepsin_L [Hexamita inflata]|uniref:Cathepsin L n=1 Tax=Hexamita inflata TaxID=28002 RepID=A0AA86P008_9EUKA|nr:Cathepsin L [Hexamita inflata]
MFISLVLCNPVFGDFTAKINFRLPYANNTQFFTFVNDAANKRQYFEYYNQSGAVIDTHLTHDEKTVYYTRTEIDKLTCQIVKEEATMVVPDLTNFTKMDDTIIDGVLVHHYRFKSIYMPEDDVSGSAYLAAQTYQQDFYMKNEIPFRWEIWGRSNFDSHQDYYILDYITFETKIDASVFAPTDLCKKATHSLKHVQHPASIISLHQQQSAPSSENFKQTVQRLLNLKPKSYRVSPNKFSEYSATDLHFLKKRILRNEPTLPTKPLTIDQDFVSQKHFDWRIRGGIAFVKDQVACGSCWTFGATGVLEARINIQRLKENKNAELLSFSEQSVVDCFWDYDRSYENSNGCEGGSSDYGLKWFTTLQGFALQVDYPYLGQNDFCKKDLFTYKEYEATGAYRVPANDVDQLKMALKDGPVAVAVTVSDGFVFYSGGILDDASCSSEYDKLGHAVVLVGWGTDAEVGEYWIIRNSWSNVWGMDGYINIKIAGNICGVMTDASYAEIIKTAK